MVLVTSNTEALESLCSQERLDIMDSVDSLRSQGINHFVSLPQIIVCGDQSSGKSSGLEAISSVSFPVKSNLCTRFPTELVLRRTPRTSASVSIVPHHSRSDAEKAILGTFHEELASFDGLDSLIESAKGAMGISTHGKAFAQDLLRIEVSGPDRPHLTIVDLPGLIHSETKHQSATDIGLIQEVVESYMTEPRSIILAVVSAKNDFANQIVLKMARSADPTGTRTMGVITKPDTLYPGSESEALYVSLARNQEVDFRLGWHVLKNLDSEASSDRDVQRDAEELQFFGQGIWEHLPESIMGIGHLRGRLSKVLLNHIISELPSLMNEIEAKRDTCRELLIKLGQPRTTLFEQQQHLIGISESFQRLVQSAVDGNWNDPFFGDADTSIGYARRLRAVIQNLGDDFATSMVTQGHRRHIVEEDEESTDQSPHVIRLTRVEFIEHIDKKITRSRGRELPGLFQPMIVADLFRDQASPWESLALKHVHATWDACSAFLVHVISHVTDRETSQSIMREVVQPAMGVMLNTLTEKTGDILRPHQMLHPITHNRNFLAAIEKASKQRVPEPQTSLENKLSAYFARKNSGFGHSFSTNMHELSELLAPYCCAPPKQHSPASEALDHMQAYYDVAIMRVIDDIAIEAIEVVLMSALPTLLSPVKILVMPPELVSRIAGEREEMQVQRQQLTKQLDILSNGLKTCEQFGITKINQEALRKAEESFEQVAAHDTNQVVLDKKASTSFSLVAPEETQYMSQYVPSEEDNACEPADVVESSQAAQLDMGIYLEPGQDDEESSLVARPKKSKKHKKLRAINSEDIPAAN